MAGAGAAGGGAGGQGDAGARDGHQHEDSTQGGAALYTRGDSGGQSMSSTRKKHDFLHFQVAYEEQQ